MQLLDKDIMQHRDAQRKDSEDWGGTVDLPRRSCNSAEDPMRCTSAPQMQRLRCSLGPWTGICDVETRQTSLFLDSLRKDRKGPPKHNSYCLVLHVPFSKYQRVSTYSKLLLSGDDPRSENNDPGTGWVEITKSGKSRFLFLYHW